jgi:hypothetical protein
VNPHDRADWPRTLRGGTRPADVELNDFPPVGSDQPFDHGEHTFAGSTTSRGDKSRVVQAKSGPKPAACNQAHDFQPQNRSSEFSIKERPFQARLALVSCSAEGPRHFADLAPAGSNPLPNIRHAGTSRYERSQ